MIGEELALGRALVALGEQLVNAATLHMSQPRHEASTSSHDAQPHADALRGVIAMDRDIAWALTVRRWAEGRDRRNGLIDS